MPRRFIVDTQDRRGMDGGETSAAIRPAQQAAPLAREDDCATHESASRDGAKGNDELRIDQRQFPVEPPAALLHFASIWVLVKTPFAPFLVLEMLYGVGDIDRTPVEANRAQGLVEDAAGRSDERTTSAVFLIAGLLANHHESPLGLHRKQPASHSGKEGSADNWSRPQLSAQDQTQRAVFPRARRAAIACQLLNLLATAAMDASDPLPSKL
jgi:hypothetical protein